MKTYVFNVTWIDRSGLSFTQLGTWWNVAWSYNFLKQKWNLIWYGLNRINLVIICNERSFIIILDLIIEQSFHSQIHYFKYKWYVSKSNELKIQKSFSTMSTLVIRAKKNLKHDNHPSIKWNKRWFWIVLAIIWRIIAKSNSRQCNNPKINCFEGAPSFNRRKNKNNRNY